MKLNKDILFNKNVYLYTETIATIFFINFGGWLRAIIVNTYMFFVLYLGLGFKCNLNYYHSYI